MSRKRFHQRNVVHFYVTLKQYYMLLQKIYNFDQKMHKLEAWFTRVDNFAKKTPKTRIKKYLACKSLTRKNSTWLACYYLGGSVHCRVVGHLTACSGSCRLIKTPSYRILFNHSIWFCRCFHLYAQLAQFGVSCSCALWSWPTVVVFLNIVLS